MVERPAQKIISRLFLNEINLEVYSVGVGLRTDPGSARSPTPTGNNIGCGVIVECLSSLFFIKIWKIKQSALSLN
jgi:hypothetical protein